MRRLVITLAALGALSPAAAQTPANSLTQAANAAIRPSLNTADARDIDFASRGFIATRTDPLIKAADGRVVWNLDAYAFLAGDAPASANPSLWRQAQLLAKHGLFQVGPHIFQVRGFDLANVTFIEGATGVIVVDPLTSAETAKAALELYRAQRGPRPIRALIYTHPHVDHFGGARGMVEQKDVESGAVQVLAPQGFLEHAVSENVIAGVAMARRATYQFGTFLPRNAQGQVSSGIGQAVSAGTQTLIAPTREITHTGETITIDGVRFEFQMTPGTEAPAEMNFYLPDMKALCLSENANATMHNILTPRGALVRDAKAWADYLSESLRLYGGREEVMFTSHAWPRWGAEVISEFIRLHRDAYEYLHDQSVRMMNQGLTGSEIAETIKLPDVLARQWFNRGYYGTMKFNAKAVYQRYMGWYDGNPANLDPLPPVELAKKRIAAMGGAKKVLSLAQRAVVAGDQRWAASLLNDVIFADPTNVAAKQALAASYDQLGYQAESALWRNMYLAGAAELRGGVQSDRSGAASLDLVRNTPTPLLFDLLAVRLNGDRAIGHDLAVIFAFPDRNERVLVTIENGVLLHEVATPEAKAQGELTMARADFIGMLFAGAKIQDKIMAGQARLAGDASAFVTFASLFDKGDAAFPIVTP